MGSSANGQGAKEPVGGALGVEADGPSTLSPKDSVPHDGKDASAAASQPAPERHGLAALAARIVRPLPPGANSGLPFSCGAMHTRLCCMVLQIAMGTEELATQRRSTLGA